MKNILIILLTMLPCLHSWAAPKSRPGDVGMPDFAYPQTVAADARKNLDASVGSKEWPQAVKALIELTMANTLVDGERAGEMAATIDSVGALMPADYAAVCDMLHARLLADYYVQKRWSFDSRTLPLDSYPENMADWSRGLFAQKICGLVDKSLGRLGSSAGVKLTAMAPFITSVEFADYVPDERSFLIYKGVELLELFSSSTSVIPFKAVSGGVSASPYEHARSMADRLLDMQIEETRAGGSLKALAYAMASKAEFTPASERCRWLGKCFDELADHPESILILNKMSMYCSPSSFLNSDKTDAAEMEKARVFCSRAQKALDRWPTAFGAPSLRNTLQSMLAPGMRCTQPGQQTSASDVNVSVRLCNTADTWLLLFKLPEYAWEGNKTVAALTAKARPVKSIRIPGIGEAPSRLDTTVSFGRLPYGVYMAVPSLSQTASGIPAVVADKRYSPFRVSDLQTMTVSASGKDQARRVYVVSAIDGRPVAGATVAFRSYSNNRYLAKSTLTTNSEGYVAAPQGSWNLSVAKGSDRMISNAYLYTSSDEREFRQTSAEVLTDLSVYHPGDSVGFVGVVYGVDGTKRDVLADKGITVRLYDANNTIVNSSELTTDRYGRASGRFTLPTTGLLGRWSIEMRDGERSLGRRGFEVADYKAPTFFVSIDSVSTPKGGDTMVEITGKAMTYSGMPVAEADIEYSIRYVSWWCWRGGASTDAAYSGSARTGADGIFRISLDTKPLENTPYAFGAYRLSVAATSQAGETQQAAPASFALGSAYSVDAAIPAFIEADSAPYSFKVSVRDMLGLPAVKKVLFTVEDSEGKTVSEGEFTSPDFKPGIRRLASGRYFARFSVEGADTASSAKSEFIVWRASDARPPVATHLWTPVMTVTAREGEKEVEIPVGSSFKDSHILCIISSSDAAPTYEWLTLDAATRRIKVKAPEARQRKWLVLNSVSDCKPYSATIEVLPAESARKLEIKTETFRDRLVPGDEEHWKFLFTFAGKPAPFTPAMAVMTDKAIDAVAPFAWNFYPAGRDPFNRVSADIYSSGERWYTFRFRNLKQEKTKRIEMPDWQTWGNGLMPHSYRIRGTRRLLSAGASSEEEVIMADGVVNEMKSSMTLASVQPTSRKMESAESVEEEAADAYGADAGSGAAESEPLREMEHPLAFFMPMLTANADGVTSIDFTVPDFNTTWKLQLLGYTDNLQSAVSTFEATASKPVMVSCNAPQFLRTGDEASISATLFNATPESCMISGRIEVIDPMTGLTIASFASDEKEVGASGSTVITTRFRVPSELDRLLVRAYAYSKTHTDGEQTLIPVLPSSTPVVESTAFYIGSAADTFETRLPDFEKGAKLTLQYCDNPVWYCVTALPSISMPQSRNLLSLLRAYYGSATASGLAAAYPQIKTGLEKILASAPVSPLSENADLKTVDLINTPWVNNAASETARMRSLSLLLESASPTLDPLLDEIMALRRSDGGWSWCPGMESSLFMTSNVVLHFGMLRQNGYLPSSGRTDKAMKEAVGFIDSRTLKEWERNERRLDVGEALDWLYTRGFFASEPKTGSLAQLHAKALALIKSDWRRLSLGGKARAAIVLHRHSADAEARRILESLRQLAVDSPEAGMRYENLSSSWSATPSLLATAQVLEAFAIVDPQSPCVDKLRQGLIMQREVQDWGADSYTVDAVQAILTSGSDWTGEAKEPEITLGGRRISLPETDSPVGYFRVDIPSCDASGKSLSVRKGAAGPAWGSVMAQYVAPIADVKAASMPEISITKAVYEVVDRPGETVSGTTRLKVGDKVRVTLTVNTTRDMDYVAVLDPRSACLRPVEQLSGYSGRDGLWLYREVRDDSTNFFIGFLPKGSHVISYDCYVDREGEYSLGVASAQSQYAPQITAHSAGTLLNVGR